MNILGKLKKRLDNPGIGRAILSVLGTIHIFIKTRKIVKVFYDTAWGHEYDGAILFDRDINYSLSKENFIEDTKDSWLIAYKPKAGDVVIDIGAGIGAETYFFSNAVGPLGRIISIEAHPETFKCLQKMVQYNKLKNVTSLNQAIQDNESTVYINDPDSHIGASIVGITEGYAIAGTTLDALIEKNRISEIAFIKMNIEGAEKYAIEGMISSIRIARTVSISCHDFIAEDTGRNALRTKQTVIEFLRQNDFEIILREDDPRAWIRDTVHGINRRLVKSLNGNLN